MKQVGGLLLLILSQIGLKQGETDLPVLRGSIEGVAQGGGVGSNRCDRSPSVKVIGPRLVLRVCPENVTFFSTITESGVVVAGFRFTMALASHLVWR